MRTLGGFKRKDTTPAASGQERGEQMKNLQIKYLMRLHGVPKARAKALAVMVWGAS